MEGNKKKTVLNGNAFYEIDLECIKEKEQIKEDKKEQPQKRQRK